MQFSTDVHRQDSRSLVQTTRCCSWDSRPDWDTAFGNTSGVALRPASPVIHTGYIRTISISSTTTLTSVSHMYIY